MRINNTNNENNLQFIQQYQKTDRAAEGDNRNVLGNASPEEKVNLSAAARDIQNLSNAVSQLPDVRTDLVELYQTRIEQGTYTVDGEKVLQSMAGESLLDIFA